MSPSRVPLIAALVFLTSLAATLGAAHAIRQDAIEDASRGVAALADEGRLTLGQQLWTYGIALRGGASFFDGAHEINREDWRAYVEKLQVTERLPGVQGYGFVEWIPAPRLAEHEARVRAEGFPDYRVQPVTPPQAAYSSIVYLEPFTGRNLRAFGYNMYSEPVRRAAMDQARDTGLGSMTGKVRLLQEDGRDEQAGFLMYVPVYRAGVPVGTVAERRAALRGWVYSPFRMRDMLEAALRDAKGSLGRDFFLTVYDGGEARPDALMFDNRPADLVGQGDVQRQQRLLEFRGQRWLLVFTQPLVPGSGRLAVWLALGAGSVISLLLGGLVYVLGRTRERARRMAEEMTADLRASAERLRLSEERTRELEYRWKFALEGSDLGVWDWNVATGEVWFSPRWKEMLGFEEHEIQGSLSEWESRVHPDDKPAVMKDVQAAFEGRVRLYVNEHRVRCKDGSYRWILDRGIVVARAPDGTPLRMLGTHADVTHTHEARARIRRLDNLYAALSACNGAIVRATSEAELFAEVCQAIVNTGGAQMAWIGRIDPVLRRVQPVEAYGHGTDYLDGIEISTDPDSPLGRGPTGSAARENRAVWATDYAQDPALAPWHARGEGFGWVASGALPLRREGAPVAVLSLYVGETGQLDEESRALLEEMASDLSYALERFAAEAASRAAQAEREAAAQRQVQQLEHLLQQARGEAGAARSPAESGDAKD